MAEPFLWPRPVSVSRLTGQLLVASPHLHDPNFSHTVVYLLDHSTSGALGVIINRPSVVEVGAVLSGWADADPTGVLYHGGPVSQNCALGVAVACAAQPPRGWQGIDGSFGLVDLDAPVEQYSRHVRGVRIFAGYAGWDPGQLEEELSEDAWFVVDALPGDLLTAHAHTLWRAVLRRQTNDLVYLSTYVDDPSLN